MARQRARASLEQLSLLHRFSFSHLTDDEFAFVCAFCAERGLSPWMRHVVAERAMENGRPFLRMIVTIDALRLIAERTGEYTGQTPPQWCGKDGAWRDVWTEPHTPFASLAGIRRRGFEAPIFDIAEFDQYAQMIQIDDRMVPNDFWLKMGTLMIAKCAEAKALRKAFPEQLSGLYTREEMMQRSNPAPVHPTSSDPPGVAAKIAQLRFPQPDSRFQLDLDLIELGIKDIARRNELVAMFRNETHAELHDAPEFYQRIIRELAARPERYGVQAV